MNTVLSIVKKEKFKKRERKHQGLNLTERTFFRTIPPMTNQSSLKSVSFSNASTHSIINVSTGGDSLLNGNGWQMMLMVMSFFGCSAPWDGKTT
ncbi:hypothetical protein T06_5570 [Trichinella sp. T6]|nr:hypothetical protein T06_5570 [Trichinella sp. T6]